MAVVIVVMVGRRRGFNGGGDSSDSGQENEGDWGRAREWSGKKGLIGGNWVINLN